MRFLNALFVLSLLSGPASGAPTTPDAFVAAVKSAFDAKSTDQLLALTYTNGMSDADKKMTVDIAKMVYFQYPANFFSLLPVPNNYQSVNIANGKKYEPTAEPHGFVLVKFTNLPGHGSESTMIGYAIVDGTYYLLGTKTTDLDWKGPPDKTLGFMVMGQGQNAVLIDVKWNASGVEQERTFKTPSTGFMGQYFEAVTVTSNDDNADLTLTLMENGNQIYVSPPHKGKGTITYKK